MCGVYIQNCTCIQKKHKDVKLCNSACCPHPKHCIIKDIKEGIIVCSNCALVIDKQIYLYPSWGNDNDISIIHSSLYKTLLEICFRLQFPDVWAMEMYECLQRKRVSNILESVIFVSSQHGSCRILKEIESACRSSGLHFSQHPSSCVSWNEEDTLSLNFRIAASCGVRKKGCLKEISQILRQFRAKQMNSGIRPQTSISVALAYHRASCKNCKTLYSTQEICSITSVSRSTILRYLKTFQLQS